MSSSELSFTVAPREGRTQNTVSFHQISPADAEWMRPMLQAENTMSTTGNFSTHLLWGSAYSEWLTPFEGRILAFHSIQEQALFAYPMGSGPLQPAVQMMLDIAQGLHKPLVLLGITPTQRKKLEAELPGTFTYVPERSSFDYVYTVQRLATLSGKKLQAKRNHCNRFEKEHPDYIYRPLAPADFAECRRLLDEWTDVREAERNPEQLQAERAAMETAFSYMPTPGSGMLGGCLFAGGRLVAFTMGSLNGENSVDVHFEKADPNMEGAFSMINRCFARMVAEQYPQMQYLNREEDMGLDGLRQAKLSYQPDILLEKCIALGPEASADGLTGEE